MQYHQRLHLLFSYLYLSSKNGNFSSFQKTALYHNETKTVKSFHELLLKEALYKKYLLFKVIQSLVKQRQTKIQMRGRMPTNHIDI